MFLLLTRYHYWSDNIKLVGSMFGIFFEYLRWTGTKMNTKRLVSWKYVTIMINYYHIHMQYMYIQYMHKPYIYILHMYIYISIHIYMYVCMYSIYYLRM